MKVWKFAVIAGCVYAVSLPAMAQQARPQQGKVQGKAASRNAAPSVADMNEMNAGQFKMSKQAYIAEITKSFELMDTNGDGYIDSQEMSMASEQGVRDPKDPLDDSELDSARELKELQEFQARNGMSYINQPGEVNKAAPAPASRAADPAVGIPPINSDQLLKK